MPLEVTSYKWKQKLILNSTPQLCFNLKFGAQISLLKILIVTVKFTLYESSKNMEFRRKI